MNKVNVFITVDTEYSIGGAFRDPNLRPVGNEKRVFGKIGDKFYGIPLIMDIADRHGIPLTFFVEALNKYFFGEEESRKACEYILKRGHDIQLHLHPNYLSFNSPDCPKQVFSDFIGSYRLAEQIDLIKEGIEILLRNDVPKPIAFRAGCFGANQDTLLALKQNGILIDCSYNRAYVGNTCLMEEKDINDLTCLCGVWEFPVTNFIESTRLRSKRFMPLDIAGVSFQEMKFVLNQAKTYGPHNVTIILHSFSFLKSYDVQYIRIKPRRHVIRRFEKLCNFLKENQDSFEVKTFGSFHKQELSELSLHSAHNFSRVPARFSLIRGVQQLKDNLF